VRKTLRAEEDGTGGNRTGSPRIERRVQMQVNESRGEGNHVCRRITGRQTTEEKRACRRRLAAGNPPRSAAAEICAAKSNPGRGQAALQAGNAREVAAGVVHVKRTKVVNGEGTVPSFQCKIILIRLYCLTVRNRNNVL